ncbi:NCS1 family transporter [Geodermatophilus sp. DSM 45219]|uniref:NCS1 family transporter n=1 Tax=Geodermatophilus sp. DSM 45219 TaxID=1881103 RepID=UPI000890424D|nr:NCS1 family transporter [Geodermatophilus sp. DSM 45219]SDO22944.1 nucleobase:cation symporter-1, NCS1 family [Geodermatophilus sp. DSM 45219]
MTTASDPRTGADRRPRNHLLEESILPVRLRHRTIGALGFVWIWIGMAVIIATFQLGANGVAGLPLPVVLLTILLANAALAVVMTLTADIGTEHGLSFAVYLRAPFGTLGTHLPAVSRGIVAAIWFGIQTYLGALAINGIVEYFTGFSAWFLWYVVFGLVQIVNTAMGIKAVERLAAVAAPAIIAVSVWMYFTLEDLARTQGQNIWTFAGDTPISAFSLFVANMAFWSALAVDIPNLTRFVKTESGARSFARRNKNVFVAQFVALPVTQTFVALIGAVSFIAAGDWNPITVIQGQSSGFTLVVLLALVILAQWSTNNAANLIPAALTFVNAGAPHLAYKWGVALAGVVGTLAFPWLILNNLFTFLGYYGALLSAVGGIMIADYYVVRRRRLNVPALYQANGQFRFSGGVNPAGLIAWVVAGGLALWQLEYAYLVGLPVGFLVYLLLMRFWIVPRHPQAEITSGFSDEYLGTSAGQEWAYDEATGLRRVPAGSDIAVSREDL